MTESEKHRQIRQVLESAVEEVEYVESIDCQEDRFFLEIDGGKEVAEHTVWAVEKSGLVEDGYVVETFRDPDTNELKVQIKTEELKETEERVKENLNHYMEKYGT